MINRSFLLISGILTFSVLLSACGGGSGGAAAPTQTVNEVQNEPVVETPVVPDPEPVVEEPVAAPDPTAQIDIDLFALINAQGITGDPTTGRNLPSIDEPLADLGKALFFAKNLGGQTDAACVSCHHPSLGGGDDLSLPVGVDAVNLANVASPSLLGVGRFHNSNLPVVPRNAPTIFNTGLWDSGLFWDSRVQSEDGLDSTDGAMGTSAGIITPDSANNTTIDSNLPSGVSLANAQSRFPVTSSEEMRADFLSTSDNQTLRASLASRLDDGSLGWRNLFDNAFGDEAINFDRIAEAIAAYEESLVFVDNPWKAYVQGDFSALSNQQKRGAILFFTSETDGGGGCSSCHSGDFFTDESHHVLGFPQIGPGKGAGGTGDADFGRQAITGNNGDQHHFRTPSLLNIAVTAPYGHTGAYQTLNQVLDHYNNPRNEVEDFFGVNNLNGGANFTGNGDYCNLPQIEDIVAKTGQTCAQVYNSLNPNAIANSNQALNFINNPNANNPLPNININGGERNDIEAFLQALTDPCVENRTCLDPWIIDVSDQGAYPDTLPLIAVDENGIDL